uniref:Uncharacterized protein n=1 Tax=Aotus nancymaae TaxID=37293 RepID=A0A2K5F936_AOTNA
IQLEYKSMFTGSYSYHSMHSIHMNSWMKISAPAFSGYLMALHNHFHPNLGKSKFKQFCIYSKRNSLSCLILVSLTSREGTFPFVSLPPLTFLTTKNTQQTADLTL